MKAEALHAFGIEPPRDGKELGHARHVPVKRRVKARHLRHARVTAMKHLHELNARGHVLGIVRD